MGAERTLYARVFVLTLMHARVLVRVCKRQDLIIALEAKQ